MKRLLIFLAALIAISGLAYYAHCYVLESMQLYSEELLLGRAYLVNLILGLIIVSFLYILRFKYTSSLGFLYMGGSMVKFLFFFLFFNGSYRADDELTRIEFFSFFIPYVIILIAETLFLVRVFNELDGDVPAQEDH